MAANSMVPCEVIARRVLSSRFVGLSVWGWVRDDVSLLQGCFAAECSG